MNAVVMQDLVSLAAQSAVRLKERQQTLTVAESSAGGLISAALLAVPGASAYYLGGTVVYTYAARTILLGLEQEAIAGMRSATEPYTLALARTARERLHSTWGLAETGATGPSGNRYGDAPGHGCLAVSGPLDRTRTLETGSTDRIGNMYAFASAALALLLECLE